MSPWIRVLILTSPVAAVAGGAAGIVLAPNRLNFKIENPSKISPAQTVRLWNNSAVGLAISGITTSGDFAETDNCPATLASGAECVIQVTFKPTAVGVRSGTLSVADQAPNNLQTVSLSGMGGAPTLYVATNGNDSWSGMLVEPNLTNTDGPFATLDQARSVVRGFQLTGIPRVDVQIRGGTYSLTAPIQFSAADSGSATTEIVYQNYRDERPVFSGGVRVTNWTNVGGNKWQTTLPASAQLFENLFYNGVRRLRPRLGGYLGTYLRNVGPVYSGTQTADCSEFFSGMGWECFDRFVYSSSDPISGTWENLAPAAGNACGQPAGNAALAGDIELVNFEQYSVSKLRVSCIDAGNHIVYLTGDTATETDHPTSHGYIPGHRYLIENVEDAFTQPGQWFLDRSASPWTLTYLANPGENPDTDSVVIPQSPQLLIASGLQHVTFRGLTFAYDNFTLPARGYGGDAELISAVSFQNAQNITFDSDIVAHTSATALEFISCVDKSSLNWCVNTSVSAVTAQNLVENSAFYDLGAGAIRIGTSGNATDTNANVPQFNTVMNTVVEGYGRIFASSKGISQGQGHDNLYTHNEIYDGYKGAIKICYCANSDSNPPFTNNNVVSFNHVHDLFQGIMNDSGSIYFGVGTPSPPQSGTGNRMLNNVVHDVNDASVMDPDGYGGDGLYFDDFTGLADAENNLVYRVSGNAISFSGPRAGPNQQSIVKNNILAFARQSMINAYDPYSFTSVPPSPLFFVASNNLLYFDRNGGSSSGGFYTEGGCTWPGASVPFTAYQQWTSNLYWRADGTFGTDIDSFHVQTKQDASNNCAGSKFWTFYTLAQWQGLGEDAQSIVKDPGFGNPVYPGDDFSLPSGSPGVGFVPFDPSQAGRANAAIQPPPIPSTFPTQTFNPAADF